MRYPALGLAMTVLLTACAKPAVPPQTIAVVTPVVERLSSIPRQARVFTYVDEQRGFKAADQLIYATGDGGRTWNQVGATDSPVIYLDFVTATEGWAATDSGLRRSTDGGRTWQPGTELIRDRVDRIDFADGQHGWVTNGGHLLTTADGGTTWLEMQPCTGLNAISLPTANTGFVLCTPGGGALGHQSKSLFRTVDGGGHWSLVTQVPIGSTSTTGLPEYGAATDLFFLADAEHGWLSTDRNGAYATTDGGQTWHQLGLRLGADFRGIRFPTPEHGFALSNWAPGLFLETQDGGATWAQIYPDLEPAGTRALLDDHTVIGEGTLQDPGAILRSEDGGWHWQQVASIQGYIVGFSFADSLHGWALVNRSTPPYRPTQLYRTADGGRTWTGPLPGLSGLDLNGLSASLVDAQVGYVADNDGTLRQTTDGGSTFTALPQPLGQNDVITFGDAQHGWKQADGRLFATADEGKTWEAIDLPYKVMRIHAASGAQAWALVEICDQTVQKCHDAPMDTTDLGRSWIQFDLGNQHLYDVIPARDGQHVWLVGDSGILATADGGKHWIEVAR